MNNQLENIERFTPDAPAPIEGDTRGEHEVKAAIVLARRFPRDETDAIARIDRSCQRAGLAEVALYTYPRGGAQVEGPSIRLAETMAQAWGNIHFGVKEIHQTSEHSVMQSYCWDLETNVRQEKTFTVRHEYLANKKKKKLTDPRDIYEYTANMAARRLRACILAILPGDVTERAVERCRKTMTEQHDQPLADRISDMVIGFRNHYGVTKKQLEVRLGHTIETTSEAEMVTLKGIFRSVKDGMSAVKDHFDTEVETVQPGKALPPAIGEPEAAPPQTEVVQGKPENLPPEACVPEPGAADPAPPQIMDYPPSAEDIPTKPIEFDIVPGNGHITVYAMVDEGVEVDHWESRKKPDKGRWSGWSLLSDLASHTIEDIRIGPLTNGMMYTFEVRIVTEEGPGQPSNQRSCQPANIENGRGGSDD